MLKKIKMMAAVTLSFVAISLFGCSDLNNLNDELSVFTDEERCIVEISVTNLLSSSRQVFPEAWDNTSIRALDLFISGTSARGETLTEKQLTAIKTNPDGKEKVELSYSYWDLTLTAKQGGEIVLQANSTVDLTNGVKTVPFTLSSKNVSTPGSVLIEGTYEADPNSVNKIVMGLYNYGTGALADGIASETVYDESNIPAGNKFSYNVASVKPGTYMFNVGFYKKVGDDEYKKIGNYGDLVTVISGKASEDKNVNVTTINKKPASPSNLVASFEDDYMDAGAGYYTVNLEWEDNSYNEENFVITVYKYSAWDGTPTVYKTLGVTNKPSENKYSFVSDAMRDTGSVLAGNTSVRLQLQYGEIYDFGIQAENCIGLSDENPVMRVAGTGTEDYTADHIARTLITYNLNGGKLVPTGETEVYAGTAWLEAVDYAGADVDLATTIGTLTKGEFTFQSWADSTADDATVVTTTNGVGNITVYAKYADKPYVVVDLSKITAEDAKNSKTLVETDLSITYDGNPVTSTDVISVATSGGNKKLSITIDDTNFEGCNVLVDGVSIGSTSNNTLEIKYSQYKDFSGQKELLICTKYKANNELYSCKVKVTFGM